MAYMKCWHVVISDALSQFHIFCQILDSHQMDLPILNEFTGYSCSYRLVADYVSTKKVELRLKKNENYLPLIHKPGEGQADFGNKVFYENPMRHVRCFTRRFMVKFRLCLSGMCNES